MVITLQPFLDFLLIFVLEEQDVFNLNCFKKFNI